jgi:glycosyltransferase involved in cell wall biosynthesis
MENDYFKSSRINPPELTIGLGAYNNARFLGGALEALLSQTFKDFELVISDNASTDETLEIIKKFADNDSRIRVFRQSENIGLVKNFNFLRKQARGEFFMWAACDDRWAPNYVETILSGLEKDPSIVLGFSPFQYVDEEGKSLGSKKQIDFSGSNALIRLLRYFINYDDNMVYGIYRYEKIKDQDFPIWWRENINTPLDCAYPFLAYVLAKGKFQIFGSQALFFKCMKSARHFEPFKQTQKAIQFFLFFLLRKINVAYVQFQDIRYGSSSLMLALIFIPILLLRIAMDMTILFKNIARKNFKKILVIPNS